MGPKTATDGMLTVKEAADYLKLSETMVRRHIEVGRLDVVKTGARKSKTFIPLQSLEDLKTRFGRQQGNPVVIAVVNQKGGVGKTTTADYLGRIFAKLKKRTLLIDLDPQGSLSEIHWYSKGGLMAPEGELPAGAKLLVRSYSSQYKEFPKSVAGYDGFLSIIPNDPAGFNLEQQLPPYGRDQLLKDALTGLAGLYDVIIIDNNPSKSVPMINAVVAADIVLVPTPPERLPMKGLDDLINTVREAQKANLVASQLRIVCTRFGRNETHDAGRAELEMSYPGEVMTATIPEKQEIKKDQALDSDPAYIEVQKEYFALANELAELMPGRL